jgi:hypothetical protein
VYRELRFEKQKFFVVVLEGLFKAGFSGTQRYVVSIPVSLVFCDQTLQLVLEKVGKNKERKEEVDGMRDA